MQTMYPDGPGRRFTPAEFLQRLGESLDAEVLYGIDRVLYGGRANTDRLGGFHEPQAQREWKLPATEPRPLEFQTPVIEQIRRPHVALILGLGFGNGSPLPQPTGAFEIRVNGRTAAICRVVSHDQLWRHEDCRLAFSANRIESAQPWQSMTLGTGAGDEQFAAYGPAVLVFPAGWVRAGEAATVQILPRFEVASTRWLGLIDSPNIVHQADLSRVEAALTGPRPRSGGWNVYFGDIHTHSGQVLEEPSGGCGTGTREQNYRYAAGPGGLDFYALTEHEWQIDPADPRDYFRLADDFQREGSFACLPAYEFTSRWYGHRNVYFLDPEAAAMIPSAEGNLPPGRCPADKAVAPERLWEALEQLDTPFFTAPHHPSAASHPCNLAHYHPRHDRLVEVYSVWGSSEYYGDFPRGVSDRIRGLDVREALRRGWRIGLVGGSDGHDGHPGNAQSPLDRHHHQFHFLGSGYAAVLAEELTREAVWEALYGRRCYATTGVPIVLSVTCGGAPMGSELPSLPAGQRPRLQIDVRGTNGLDHLRIVKNARVVQTLPCHGEWIASLEWTDESYDPSEPASYYVRVVQVDRQSAWSSPIYLLPTV